MHDLFQSTCFAIPAMPGTEHRSSLEALDSTAFAIIALAVFTTASAI
jgi:hypothetical protein